MSFEQTFLKHLPSLPLHEIRNCPHSKYLGFIKGHLIEGEEQKYAYCTFDKGIKGVAYDTTEWIEHP